jgi:penicillin V acylase-like amidase (Ntn superfamily)
MDWPESTEPNLTVFPRGIARDGGKLGAVELIKVNPAKWTSKYASDQRLRAWFRGWI